MFSCLLLLCLVVLLTHPYYVCFGVLSIGGPVVFSCLFVAVDPCSYFLTLGCSVDHLPHHVVVIFVCC